MKLSKQQIKKLPKYVSLDGTAMRLYAESHFGENDTLEYYRDAGIWSVEFKLKDGKVYSVSSMEWLDNIELIPISYAEWKKSNNGYIDKDTKAYGV